MKNELQNIDDNCIRQRDAGTDSLDSVLQSMYHKEPVSQDVKIRLKNRLECQKAMETGHVSLWWLPATFMTVVSFALSVYMCVGYVVININGAIFWMPNFLQFVSGLCLKVQLTILGTGVLASWLITVIGVWKGNLVKGARIL